MITSLAIFDKITLHDGTISIDPSITEAELETQWGKLKAAIEIGNKADEKVRKFAIEKYGEEKAGAIEDRAIEIVTELGLKIRALEVGNKGNTWVATAGEIVRAFNKNWPQLLEKISAEDATIEQIELVLNGLKPAAEGYERVREIYKTRKM